MDSLPCASLLIKHLFQFLQKQFILDFSSPNNKSGYYLIYIPETKPSEAEGLTSPRSSQLLPPTLFIKRSRSGLSSKGILVDVDHIPDWVPEQQGWGP